jgi:hypothetical protein
MTHHPNYRELKEETNLDVEELLENHVRTFEGNAVSEPICRLIFTYVADITDAQLANFHLKDESYNSLLSEFRENGNILNAMYQSEQVSLHVCDHFHHFSIQNFEL